MNDLGVTLSPTELACGLFFFAVELSNSLFATLSLADCEGLKTHDFQMLGGQSWQTVAHCWEFFFSGTPEGEEFAFSILQVLL